MATKQKQTDNNTLRIRLSIPRDDVAAVEWLEKQYTPSMSIRMLIRDAIEKYGMRDFFATDKDEIRQLPRRGRPPKTVDDADVSNSDEESHVVADNTSVDSDISERIKRMQGLMNK